MDIFQRHRDEQDVFLANHEAGHAMVGWSSRFISGITCVSIVADAADGSGGRTACTLRHESGPLFCFDLAVGCLAGLAGEMEALGKCRSLPSGDDLIAAASWTRCAMAPPFDWPKLESKLCGFYADVPTIPVERFLVRVEEPVLEVMRLATRHARGRIRQFRPQFDALYAELIKHRQLNKLAIDTILGPRPWASL